MNKKNKSNSNDQSELTFDTRICDKIGHVLNWHQKPVPENGTGFWCHFPGRLSWALSQFCVSEIIGTGVIIMSQ